MINKILLINPNTSWVGGRKWLDIPTGLCMLKAYIKDEFEVKIIDANFKDMSPDELKNEIINYSPDVIGLTCMSFEYKEILLETAKLIKSISNAIQVVVGGVYPTLFFDEIIKFQAIDYIILNEGEKRLKELLKILSNDKIGIENLDGLVYKKDNEVIIQKRVKFIENLDELPYPDYSDINLIDYGSTPNKYEFYHNPSVLPYARIQSSRGCPFKCVFCSNPVLSDSRIRYRSADHVLGEIDFLVKNYGIKEIVFSDDNLVLDRERAIKIFKGLIERNYDLKWMSMNVAVYALDDELLDLMTKSGAYKLFLAVESGVENSLKRMRKPLSLNKVEHVVASAKKLDFLLVGFIVFGFPWETWEEIRQSFKYAEKLDLDYWTFNIATPFPQTELFDMCKSSNAFLPDFDFDSNNFKSFGMPCIRTENFLPEELIVMRAFEWDRINFGTQAKKEKAALLNGLTLEEVEKWRINTRHSAIELMKNKRFA